MRSAARLVAAAAMLLALQAAVAAPANAQVADPSGDHGPVLFEADDVRHDRETGIVVATGHVRFSRGDRTLFADRVVYDQRAGTVTASSNVRLHEPTGEVVFADEMVLDDPLKEAVVENIALRFTDDSRVAAASGRRTGDGITEFRKMVYSPCKLCEDDPDSEPIWQLKAYKATHDQNRDDIIYEDAFLEFFGLPVFYVPWFSHPDPTVERRSGFLLPSYISDDDLGVVVKTPYYLDLAPNIDLTLAPVLTTREGAGAEMRFRHLLDNAEYDISGSAYYESDVDSAEVNKLRGAVRSRSRLHIDDTWRAGADLRLASDDTYMRKYEFVAEDTLENRLRLEGFMGTDYAAATGYYFQSLRSDDRSGEIPVVLPTLDYSFVGDPGPGGQLWKVDANILNLYRADGADTRRASVRTWWEVPGATGAGDIYRLFGSLQADAYWTNYGDSDGASERGRLFPQVGIDWRRPLFRVSRSHTEILEPAVTLILAPDAQNTKGIPNEDSIGVEFDDANLFATNRNTGIDRVEGNPRISYGLHGGVYGKQGGLSTFFVGQSYRFSGDNDFGARTGLKRKLSDVVGSVRVSPGDRFDLLYRFRIDNASWSMRHSELQSSAGGSRLRLDVSHLLIKEQDAGVSVDPDYPFDEREEIRAEISSGFARYWRSGVNLHRDLTGGGRSLRHGAYLMYDDECFHFRIDYSRRFTRSRLLRPQDTIFLRVGLKTLGESGFPGFLKPKRGR